MDTTIDRTNDLDLAWLIAAFLAGPLGWAFTEGAGYAAVKPVCAGGTPAVLGLIGLAGLMICVGGMWLAWRRMSSLGAVASDSGGRDIDRSYFIAAVATGFNLLVALLIVTTLASQLFGQCE
jgi:hypothetical protein